MRLLSFRGTLFIKQPTRLINNISNKLKQLYLKQFILQLLREYAHYSLLSAVYTCMCEGCFL